MYNRKYDRKTVMMKQETDSFSKQAPQTAVATIEIRNGRGKINLQGGKTEGNHAYLIMPRSGENRYADLGQVGSVFDPDDVAGTGIPIEDFDILVFGKQDPKGDFPLWVYVGFLDKRREWRRNLRKAERRNGAETDKSNVFGKTALRERMRDNITPEFNSNTETNDTDDLENSRTRTEIELDVETEPNNTTTPNGVTTPNNTTMPNRGTIPNTTMPNGTTPNNTTMPNRGTMPNTTMPNGTTPNNTTMPNGTTPNNTTPNNTTMPNRGTMPNNTTMPNRGTMPNNTTMPNGTTPNNTTMPNMDFVPDNEMVPRSGNNLNKDINDNRLNDAYEELEDVEDSLEYIEEGSEYVPDLEGKGTWGSIISDRRRDNLSRGRKPCLKEQKNIPSGVNSLSDRDKVTLEMLVKEALQSDDVHAAFKKIVESFNQEMKQIGAFSLAEIISGMNSGKSDMSQNNVNEDSEKTAMVAKEECLQSESTSMEEASEIETQNRNEKFMYADVEFFETHRDIENIFKNNDKMFPFDNNAMEWVRICPDEIWSLPIKNCKSIHNSFLLSADKKYKHILLGRNRNGNLMLAVPDCYRQENRKGIMKLGFIDFWGMGNNECKDGAYGYWIKNIR